MHLLIDCHMSICAVFFGHKFSDTGAIMMFSHPL